MKASRKKKALGSKLPPHPLSFKVYPVILLGNQGYELASHADVLKDWFVLSTLKVCGVIITENLAKAIQYSNINVKTESIPPAPISWEHL